MMEQLYDENEVLVSEKDGVYTIDIWVTEIREKLIFDIIIMFVLWPVAITTALVVLVKLSEEYFAITVPVLIGTVLLIIPIILMVLKLAKKYHREHEYKNIVVPIEVRKNTVYMDGKKVKIKYNFEEEGFDIYTGMLKGYCVDGGVTEEFRIFLENRRIPYK